MNRIEWIDFAKVLVMVLVIFDHLGLENNMVGGWVWSFHMPAFFLLSGLFAKVKGTWSESLKGDFCRLVLSVLLWHIIGMFTWEPVQTRYMHPDNFLNAYLSAQADFLLGKAWGFGWFMLALFWVRIEFRLVNKLPQWAQWSVAYVLFPLAVYALHDVVTVPFYLLQSLLAFSFYYVGHAFKTQLLENKSKFISTITPPIVHHQYIAAEH